MRIDSPFLTGSTQLANNVQITGSLSVAGTITAQTLVAQTITSSVIYSSGSNKFGDDLSDNQQFTGSVNITGSLTSVSISSSNSIVQGTSTVTGSINLIGSVISNVVSVPVVSSTASLDFRTSGCFFTLTLEPNATTHINASNTAPGLSTILVVKTNTNSQISFSNIFKQPQGAEYTPSISGSTDVLSFVTVDSSNIYTISSLKMV